MLFSRSMISRRRHARSCRDRFSGTSRAGLKPVHRFEQTGKRSRRSPLSRVSFAISAPDRSRANYSGTLSLRLAWDGLTRPAWLTGVFFRTLLKHGMPHFENSSPVRGAPVLSSKAVRDFAGRSRMTWDHIRRIREEWSGHLVLKGLLSAE